MLTFRSLSGALVLASALVSAGCDTDELFGPDEEDVVGTYNATELSISTGSGTTDLLDLGGSVAITLNLDGTTEGTYSSPAYDDEPAFTAGLDGTWNIVAGFIHLSHDSDTLLEGLVFEYDNGRLIASEVFADGVVDVVLTRPAP
ncbi:MAG: lipocalin family protein [Longimicrobiales bacterium]